ncbi:hypothetical protein Hanom_Chr01g00041981 [Helianthus anomalus]
MPVISERPPIQVSGTPVSDATLDFILNPRTAMYMPVPKAGEGSRSGPSNADVLKAAELLQQAANTAEIATEPIPERNQESSSNTDIEELFEDNEVAVLMKRVTTLEEDKIFQDVQIASLMEEITHKNQQIHELETNLGSLTAVEFAELPKESTAEEKVQTDKEREEAIDRYIQNPPRTANQKRKKKEVIMRNVGVEKCRIVYGPEMSQSEAF